MTASKSTEVLGKDEKFKEYPTVLSDAEIELAVACGIKKDPLAIDLHLCLVAAACNTYRRGTRMKPLPRLTNGDLLNISNDIANDDINAKLVCEVVNCVPSLTQIMTNPKCLNETQMKFIYWVTSELRTPLRSGKLRDLPRDIALTDPLPDYVFKVVNSETKEKEFTNLCLDNETFYALHGSSLENFHSIVQCGLLGSLSKTGLFGEGVYLSNEQSVSMNHSHSSHGWAKSKIGCSLSCVAVCQVIDNKQHVIRGRCVGSSNLSNENESSSMSRVPDVNETSQGIATTRKLDSSKPTDFPESYVLAKNGDMMILRYILVYRTARSKMRRRLMAIYDECFSWIICFIVVVFALIAYFFYSLGNEDRQYLPTDYIHHNIIV